MGFSRWVCVSVEKIVRETDKAFLVRLEDGGEEWIPFSQISDPDDYSVGDEDVEMSVTEFIAKEKGLE